MTEKVTVEKAILILNACKELQIDCNETYVSISGWHLMVKCTMIIYFHFPDARILLEMGKLNVDYNCTFKADGATAFSNHKITLEQASKLYKDINEIIRIEMREHKAYNAFERMAKQIELEK